MARIEQAHDYVPEEEVEHDSDGRRDGIHDEAKAGHHQAQAKIPAQRREEQGRTREEGVRGARTNAAARGKEKNIRSNETEKARMGG